MTTCEQAAGQIIVIHTPLPSDIQTHESEMARRRGILLLALFAGCPQILAAADNCVAVDYGTVCLDPVENAKERSITIFAHNREKYEVRSP